jgi:glycosyltransferase involved in cell wall biosynthesis
MQIDDPDFSLVSRETARGRVRVAFLDHTAKLGGGEIALLNLLASIDRQRFDPVVILFSDGPLRTKIEALGIRVFVRPLGGNIVNARKDGLGGKSLLKVVDVWRMLKFAVGLARELKKLGVEIVHTNSLKSDLIGGVAARLAGVPLVWHVRDRIARDYLPGPVAWTFRMLARILPNRVIVNSGATLETLCTRRDADSSAPKAKRYTVVHDGTNVVEPIPEQKDRCEGDYVIGLVGRISPWKGQDVFVKAAQRVHERFPKARFQIVGSAMFGEEEYERQVQELARRLLPADAIEFTGFREDVLDLISNMDLVVHASTRGEPFGQVILEGMAAGKAVVATNGGGVPEFVNDGETGILVPMGDAPAMAAAISRYLSDSTLRHRAGAMARRRVVEHFTLQHTAKKVERVFEDLISTSNLHPRNTSDSREASPSIPAAIHIGP